MAIPPEIPQRKEHDTPGLSSAGAGSFRTYPDAGQSVEGSGRPGFGGEGFDQGEQLLPADQPAELGEQDVGAADGAHGEGADTAPLKHERRLSTDDKDAIVKIAIDVGVTVKRDFNTPVDILLPDIEGIAWPDEFIALMHERYPEWKGRRFLPPPEVFVDSTRTSLPAVAGRRESAEWRVWISLAGGSTVLTPARARQFAQDVLDICDTLESGPKALREGGA